MEMIWDETPLTLADLCVAIEKRQVPSTMRDGQIEVRARDLRRMGYDDLVRRMLTMAPMDYLPLAPLDTSRLA